MTLPWVREPAEHWYSQVYPVPACALNDAIRIIPQPCLIFNPLALGDVETLDFEMVRLRSMSWPRPWTNHFSHAPSSDVPADPAQPKLAFSVFALPRWP